MVKAAASDNGTMKLLFDVFVKCIGNKELTMKLNVGNCNVALSYSYPAEFISAQINDDFITK